MIKTLCCLVGMIVLCSGCIGYQNVREYDRVGDRLVCVSQIKGLIIGTSGQQITTRDVVIEKRDSSDKAVELLKNGIAAGIAVASNAKGAI